MELRRPLTAAAAAGVLLALMFVPSGSASAEAPGPAASAPTPADAGLDLADTGSINTTPYIVGGAAFLGVGTALVTFARRRELDEADPSSGELS